MSGTKNGHQRPPKDVERGPGDAGQQGRRADPDDGPRTRLPGNRRRRLLCGEYRLALTVRSHFLCTIDGCVLPAAAAEESL